jgi:hypothetical protein
MRPGKIVLLVVGMLVGLMGLGMAGGGAALVVLAGTQRDAAGYLTASTQRYSTTTYALTAHVPVVTPDNARPGSTTSPPSASTRRTAGGPQVVGCIHVAFGPGAALRLSHEAVPLQMSSHELHPSCIFSLRRRGAGPMPKAAS